MVNLARSDVEASISVSADLTSQGDNESLPEGETLGLGKNSLIPIGGGIEVLSVRSVWNGSLWTLWSVWFLRPGAHRLQ